jgi:hypothetical protein
MSTDAPEEPTSPASPNPIPTAIRDWVDQRLDTGIGLALVGLLAVSIAVLGVCLWMGANREPIPLFAGG